VPYSFRKTAHSALFFSDLIVILGFGAPGKRASVLVFSRERAAAPGDEVGGTKGAQSKDLFLSFQ